MDETSKSSPALDRRDFFRVQARLPFRVRSVDSGEAAGLAFEIKTPRTEADEIADPGVAIVLARIEQKVDRLLAAIDRRVPKPLWEADSRELSISASGIGVEMEDGPAQEEPVLIEFVLPENPSRHVRALGRSVSADSTSAACAFAFEVIAESDREAIVRFSQDVQRSMLRMRAATP